jgi:hypothetical protein
VSFSPEYTLTGKNKEKAGIIMMIKDKNCLVPGSKRGFLEKRVGALYRFNPCLSALRTKKKIGATIDVSGVVWGRLEMASTIYAY